MEAPGGLRLWNRRCPLTLLCPAPAACQGDQGRRKSSPQACMDPKSQSPAPSPRERRTSALLQPPHSHLQVLGPAQVLPKEIIPAADLLGGERKTV